MTDQPTDAIEREAEELTVTLYRLLGNDRMLLSKVRKVVAHALGATAARVRQECRGAFLQETANSQHDSAINLVRASRAALMAAADRGIAEKRIDAIQAQWLRAMAEEQP